MAATAQSRASAQPAFGAFGARLRRSGPVDAGTSGRGRALAGGALLALMVLGGCAEREVLLVGPRESIGVESQMAGTVNAPVPENRALPISLPGAVANADWVQEAGTPSTRTTHAALSASPREAWSVDIGDGNSSGAVITAAPVVAGGRVFTLDAHAGVSAVSTGGTLLWSADLTPPRDRRTEASGGGLAYANGRIFVATGFGVLTALDAETGAVLWEQRLRAAATGAPAVYGDLVYVTAGEEVAWAVDQESGRVRWTLNGTPDLNNFAGAPVPAVTDQFAIFGFGAGELQAAFRQGGMRRWEALVTGRRLGYARANLDDITGGPIVADNRVYVGNQSGRTVALSLDSGERIWTANEGPVSLVWPVGGSVFMLSDANQLLRLDASDGSRIWGVSLPYFQASRARRQRAVFAHYGPILAGGQLIVASSDGLIRFFDPVSGAENSQLALDGGATSRPVVAGGVLYVVSADGRLHAYR